MTDMATSHFNSPGVLFCCSCWEHNCYFSHRRTSQGAGGCSPPDSGKNIIFGQKLDFSGRSQ